MHVVIMGCGRVGSDLAYSLERSGASVAVIDQDPTAFRRLGNQFGGLTVTGVGFDRDVLAEAGTARADAFAAVSSGDNSNIIGARVARETFGVQNVVARIYDPRRAEVYQRLGIPTVATVAWTADQMLRRLLPSGVHRGVARPVRPRVGRGDPRPRRVDRPPVTRLETEADTRIAFVERLGEGTIPRGETVLQDGDLVYVVTTEADAPRVEAVFGRGPEGV